MFKRLLKDESGVAIAEYALLSAFIALVAIAPLIATGTALKNIWGASAWPF